MWYGYFESVYLAMCSTVSLFMRDIFLTGVSARHSSTLGGLCVCQGIGRKHLCVRYVHEQQASVITGGHLESFQLCDGCVYEGMPTGSSL